MQDESGSSKGNTRQWALFLQRTGECLAATYTGFVAKLGDLAFPSVKMPDADRTLSKSTRDKSGKGSDERDPSDSEDGSSAAGGKGGSDRRRDGGGAAAGGTAAVPGAVLAALKARLVDDNILTSPRDNLWPLDAGVRDLFTGEYVEAPRVSQWALIPSQLALFDQ